MKKRLTPIKAIRQNCLDCCAGSAHEVRLCPILNCPLYPYRFGKNPYIKRRELSEEEKQVLRHRVERMNRERLQGNRNERQNGRV